MQKNRFVVGPQACGETFFGREAELQELEDSIFGGVGAINLIGPARIGKSSLVSEAFRRCAGQTDQIPIWMSMAECVNSQDFWTTLAALLREAVEDAGLWDAGFERHYKRIDSIAPDSPTWFEQLKTPLGSVLTRMGRQGRRLVLAIDEFDAVQRVFCDDSYHYQLLRSVYSDPRYATSGVIISRRRLNQFEVTCPCISSFHGVFREMYLLPFNDQDTEAFYSVLAQYGIAIPSGGRKRLEYYTGRMPYLLCLFGQRIVALRDSLEHFGDKEMDAIHSDCLAQIDRHYDDLIKGIEEDDSLEFLSTLSLGLKPPANTKRSCETLASMGILFQDEKTGEYCAFSKDFNDYFRSLPLRLPAWDTLSTAERKIKKIFSQEFSGLSAVNYQDLIGSNADAIRRDVSRKYPDLKLDWSIMNTYCRDLSSHKAEPTLLDVLTLGKVIAVMLDTWDARFAKYFDGDELWKTKLSVIRRLRNPIAHSQIEYVDRNELALCLKYCEELIRMD